MGAAFLAGTFIYKNHDFIFKNIRVRVGGLVLLCIARRSHESYHLFAMLLLAIGTIYIGFETRLHLPNLDRFGDYSYGLYLYAFPVQQMCVHFIGAHHPYWVNAAASVIAFGFAVVSWHWVEAPAARLKKKTLAALDRRLSGTAKPSLEATDSNTV